MRVNNQSSSFGAGGDAGERDRSGRFRKRHRAGQRVRGVVREWQSQAQGLAWVDIDGHRLLAQLPPDTRLGLERLFLVVSLEPEIVLRALPSRPGGLNVVV